MPEKMEKIMKRIHVFFSNCEVAEGDADRMIVPRKPMLNLLEEMNKAVYEIMEQYEMTEKSRERELKRHSQKAEGILKKADETAEDIYAASMLYSDRVLIELKNMIEQAGSELRKEYDFLSDQLASQIDMVASNQKEIRDFLSRTKQHNKYMQIITLHNDKVQKTREDELRTKEQKKKFPKSEFPKDEKEEIEQFFREYEPRFQDVLEDIEDGGGFFQADPDAGAQAGGGQDAGTGSLEEEADPQGGEASGSKPPAKRPAAQAPEAKAVRKIASITDSSAYGDGYEEEAVKKVSYEVKINPEYFQAAAVFSGESLDAEYEQWKNGEGGTPEELEQDSGRGRKKVKNSVFTMRKKKK